MLFTIASSVDMEILKAGCFLINTKSKCIALVYRKKQNDFSFPKGHLEKDETLEEIDGLNIDFFNIV